MGEEAEANFAFDMAQEAFARAVDAFHAGDIEAHAKAKADHIGWSFVHERHALQTTLH